MYDPERGYPRVVPYVLYADPAAAVRWLCEVLGCAKPCGSRSRTAAWATLN